MLMKSKDIAAATALLIQGYLRANGDGNASLREALAAIRSEADDWSENLADGSVVGQCALQPADLTVSAYTAGGAEINRTPFNLVSVALAALGEAIDLAGPDTIWADFDDRKVDFLAAPGS